MSEIMHREVAGTITNPSQMPLPSLPRQEECGEEEPEGIMLAIWIV